MSGELDSQMQRNEAVPLPSHHMQKLTQNGSKGYVLFLKYLFIYLSALGLSFSTRDLCCSMRDLVPLPGVEPRPPALGARSLSHWTTKEVPGYVLLTYIKLLGEN